MKKLFTTLVLSCIICTAFAQKTFKPIHFKSFMATQKSLDFNGDKNGREEFTPGIIEINVKDSVISIKPEGATPLKYKITAISEEDNDKSQCVKTIDVSCKDAMGAKCNARIERTSYSSTSFMKFYLSYSMNYVTYYCDYLKKL